MCLPSAHRSISLPSPIHFSLVHVSRFLHLFYSVIRLLFIVFDPLLLSTPPFSPFLMHFPFL
jgi:hypothetical protein